MNTVCQKPTGSLLKELATFERAHRELIADCSFRYWITNFIRLEDTNLFSFKNRRYLWQPYGDEHPKQCHKKATQMGLTTMAMLKSIYGCKTKYTQGVMYFFPTFNDVSDFSKSRIKPLINNNETIRGCMADTDEVAVKHVGRSFIYFRGMKSDTQVKSVPADMIVIDEKDNVEPEKCDMARKRLSASRYKDELYLSNPTIPNYGIDADFQESDQNYWQLKCPHCNTWNCVDNNFPGCLLHNRTQNTVILACQKCKGELDKNIGQWVAKMPDVTDFRGYHYSQLFSSTVSASEIFREYNNAQLRGQLPTFYRLTLGQAYVSAGDNLQKEQVLVLCNPEFPKDPFIGYEKIFMGVDQGKDLHIVFKKIVNGRFMTWFAEARNFEELDKWVKQCERCVIDALPETRKARELARRHPGKVFLNFYNRQQRGSIKWDECQYICQENRTESLDASHNFYMTAQNMLPQRTKYVEEFAEHCSNITRVLVEDNETGSKTYNWIKNGPDHYRHADNYAYIAMSPYIESDSVEPFELPYTQELGL